MNSLITTIIYFSSSYIFFPVTIIKTICCNMCVEALGVQRNSLFNNRAAVERGSANKITTIIMFLEHVSSSLVAFIVLSFIIIRLQRDVGGGCATMHERQEGVEIEPCAYIQLIEFNATIFLARVISERPPALLWIITQRWVGCRYMTRLK